MFEKAKGPSKEEKDRRMEKEVKKEKVHGVMFSG